VYPTLIDVFVPGTVFSRIQGHVNVGQPLNGFNNLSKFYLPMDTTLRGEAKGTPDLSKKDAYHTVTKEPVNGETLNKQPPRHSEVLDTCITLARTPSLPLESTGKLPASLKQPVQGSSHANEEVDQEQNLVRSVCSP
jgi:hypothetical protein